MSEFPHGHRARGTNLGGRAEACWRGTRDVTVRLGGVFAFTVACRCSGFACEDSEPFEPGPP